MARPMHPQIQNRAARLSSSATKIEYVATKLPSPDSTFESTFKSASGARKDFSNEFIIDVLPDFRPILTYIMYHVSTYSPLLEMTHHSKISSATLTAYCLAIVYAFILACDLRIRPQASSHAAAYDEDHSKHAFFEYMLSVPVPDFLVPILTQLSPTSDETRPNVYFGLSAAGFSYHHHFGRFFPLSMFFNMHDCIAELESRSSREVIYSDLYRRPLYKIKDFPIAENTFEASTGHFIGSGIYTNNAPSTLHSKLFQAYMSLFNPVLLRDYQRRRTLASAAFETPIFESPHMNFYDLVFSATPANFTEMKTIFRSISAALKDNITCKGDLASQFDNVSGSSILTHGYSRYALPTYFHSDIVYGSENNTVLSALNTVPAAVFAKAINYLQPPAPTYVECFPQPEGECTTDKEHEVECTHDTDACRVSPKAPTAHVPSPSRDFELFSDLEHIYPTVRVLSPTDPSSIDAWKATAFGMVIESFDIDGTVIPVPNSKVNLGVENSWFAESAIPLKYCYKSTFFGQDNQHPAYARKRAIPPRQTQFPASSLLVDRTKVNLPKLARITVRTDHAAAFPGLNSVLSVTWPTMLQSFIGFHTADRLDHTDKIDDVPNMPKDRLLVWSPYTYVGHESYEDFSPNLEENRIYFLTNLRTLFGTRIPVIELNHAFEAMPIK